MRDEENRESQSSQSGENQSDQAPSGEKTLPSGASGPAVSDDELSERGLNRGDEESISEADTVEQSDLNPPPAIPTEVEYSGDTDRERVEEAAHAGDRIDVENVVDGEPSPAERVAANARTQAGAAAEAIRRGEMMRDVSVDADADSDDRLIALLCYATQILIPLILPVLVLLSESSKNRPFQRFHAVQSLALVALLTVGAVVATTATAILAFVPFIGWLIGLLVLCISPIALLMAYFALVYYGYQAYQGKRFAIPGLTRFLQDQKWI